MGLSLVQKSGKVPHHRLARELEEARSGQDPGDAGDFEGGKSYIKLNRSPSSLLVVASQPRHLAVLLHHEHTQT